MAYRIAPSCKAVLDQADRLWPKRSRASDGTIGDAAHRHRRSDHNPDAAGWVHAVDLTHDPANGCDAHAWARQLVARRDPRVAYVISDGRIANSSPVGDFKAWEWRPYYGSNPHTKHAHVSVHHTDAARTDTSDWFSRPTPEVLVASIPNACSRFAVLANDDLVVTTTDGAIYHYDADGNPDPIDYIDAYNRHPELGGSVRDCLGVYAIGRDRKARPDGHPEAVGYCQVFTDGCRYHWVR